MDQVKRLGVAVVGVGFWGRNHARVYSELPNTELRAVCDVEPEVARSVSERFGVEGYTDSLEMLKREDVEAVSLCTWSTALASEAVRALKAGKHVLVEKPMASSPRQAMEVIDLARRSGRRLTVGFIERFNPGLRRVKEAVEGGKIGAVVSATARRVSRWPERIGDVGVVKDTAIHDIDVVRFLFAEDPVAVYAQVGSLGHTRFEDYAQIMLTFKEGGTAFIEANWLTPYKIRSLSVTGSEATIYLDYLTQEITVETTGQSVKPRYGVEEPLKLELQHFAECVLNDREPLVTGNDGLKALQVAEAALQSAARHRAVQLRW